MLYSIDKQAHEEYCKHKGDTENCSTLKSTCWVKYLSALTPCELLGVMKSMPPPVIACIMQCTSGREYPIYLVLHAIAPVKSLKSGEASYHFEPPPQELADEPPW